MLVCFVGSWHWEKWVRYRVLEKVFVIGISVDDLTISVTSNCYKEVVKCFSHNFRIRFSFIVYICDFLLITPGNSTWFFNKPLENPVAISSIPLEIPHPKPLSPPPPPLFSFFSGIAHYALIVQISTFFSPGNLFELKHQKWPGDERTSEHV